MKRLSTVSALLACGTLLLSVTGCSHSDTNSGANIVLSVDTSKTLGPIDLTKYALGQGGLSDKPMIDTHVTQIAQLHPQTIRLFVKDFFDLYPAHGQYHWDTLDKAIEARLNAGAEPIMSLAFKPKVLYPELDDTIVDPTSYTEWEQLISQLVKHCNRDKKYNIRYWEVGNEVDIGEPGGCPYKFTPRNYLAYYKHTVDAILRADPQVKVGGPALAGYKSPIADSLIQFAGEGNAPLDFLSWHIYNNDPKTIARTIDYMKQKLNRYPRLTNTETILDEWNMSLGNPVMDPYFQPAFILETTYGFNEHGLSRSAYYHIQDYLVDQQMMSAFMSKKGAEGMAYWWNVMPQYDGLYDNQGRVRPSFYAFKLLSLIHGDQLAVSGTGSDVKAFAAHNGRSTNLIFWNFPANKPGQTYKTTIQFPSADGGSIRLVRLNPEGHVNELEQIEHEHLSETKTHPLEVSLHPYEVFWVELTR